MIPKGTIINGPNGMGYEVTCDLHDQMHVLPHYFNEFGGAPKPRVGDVAPKWLLDQVISKMEQKD